MGAHMIPILCLIWSTLIYKDHLTLLNLNKTFIDWFDIQDFFALFTEDDLIRNFWGRDMCEDAGCTGNSSWLWSIAMGFFFAASLQVITITIYKFFKALRIQPE